MKAPGATILIVDDEAKNRRLLAVLLQPEGYQTCAVASGEEALASISKCAPDLILLDIMMPGIDGCQVASILKSNPATANIPIIMVTAHMERSTRLAGLDAGAEDFLTKPVDRSELWLRVRNLLRLKAFGDLKNHSFNLEQQVKARTVDLRRFRAAMDSTADAITLVSRATMCFVEVNATACVMFGYAREDFFQISPADIVGDSVQGLAHIYDDIIAGDDTKELLEIQAWRKDGSWLHVELRRHALRCDEDWIMVSVLRDITEQKRARDELRESERRFSNMLGNVKLVSIMLDRDARITYCNDHILQLTGWQRDDVIDHNWFELFIAPGQDQLKDVFAALLADLPSAWHHEGEIVTRSGGRRLIQWNNTLLRSADGDVIGAASIGADITENREAERRLQHQAHHDMLTGLPNRTLFHETLKKTLSMASDSGWLVAVLFIDLDQFKNVNDTLGHAIGDELLVQVSNRLIDCVRIRDTVGRFGGDEFALILVMQDGEQGAALVAQKVRDALRVPFELQGNKVTVTASIGISVHPADASDPDTMLKYADTAMYRAKQAGRDNYLFFTAKMNTDVVARLELETALRTAVKNEEFVLHYQPKVQLNNGRIAGVEALLRWQRPGHGLVSPNVFIPVLEETGLIVAVGSWVIASACRQIGRWMQSSIGALQVSVNVSGRQFIEGDLEADVTTALAENAIAADLLELELTESSLIANTERTIVTLQNLKRCGVQISIDDFGTGYSSLAYLRRFPIDKLKIDIAFIRDVTTNADDAAIVQAIIQMAHSLKLDVIAEGVETEAQLSTLRRRGCDQIQGFYFSKPLALLPLEALLRDDKHLPEHDGKRARVRTLLLVDDDPIMLLALERVLRQDGYHILTAQSAAEGFELLALNDVQVILCDERMPVMTGTVFLDRVKDLYPATFRIVLSGDTDLDSVINAINRGAIDRFYTKPWDNNILRANVRVAFRRYWLSHEIARGDETVDASPSEPAPR